MKLLIAIDENRGENSKLSEHFGHCPYFAIYNTDSKRLVIVKNELEHTNPNLSPVDQIMKFKPHVVFTLGIGQRAIKLFNEKEVKLKTGNYKIVREVITNIDHLEELKSGCSH